MTQDEIIEMARQVELKSPDLFKLTVSHMSIKQLHSFAELVAAKATASEREACAKLLDEEALDAFTFDDSLARATENYAELIRARGKA